MAPEIIPNIKLFSMYINQVLNSKDFLDVTNKNTNYDDFIFDELKQIFGILSNDCGQSLNYIFTLDSERGIKSNFHCLKKLIFNQDFNPPSYPYENKLLIHNCYINLEGRGIQLKENNISLHGSSLPPHPKQGIIHIDTSLSFHPNYDNQILLGLKGVFTRTANREPFEKGVLLVPFEAKYNNGKIAELYFGGHNKIIFPVKELQ